MITAKLRELLDAAPYPGPWASFTDFPDGGGSARGAGIYRGTATAMDETILSGSPWTDQLAADAALIVEAVNALPKLLAVCEAADGIAWHLEPPYALPSGHSVGDQCEHKLRDALAALDR